MVWGLKFREKIRVPTFSVVINGVYMETDGKYGALYSPSLLLLNYF